MKREMPPPRRIVYSATHSAELRDYPQRDIDADDAFWDAFMVARAASQTSKDALFALWTAVRYVIQSGIPGDVVEAGVWRGC